MKYIFLMLIQFVFIPKILAHEHNEAFFKFALVDNILQVEAEFPWTMRNALINFDPKLENFTSKQDFEKVFFNYIKENLILKNKEGIQLELTGFEELDNDSHSHQNNYILYFKGTSLVEVTNTIMFNIHKNQENYHTITWKNETFKTNANSKSFKISQEKRSNLQVFLWLLLIPVGLILGRFIYNKIASKN